MDAGSASAPADLENGGGAGAGAFAIEMRPRRADRELREKQPVTWLRAAPYIFAVLAGAALFAAGLVLLYSADHGARKQQEEGGAGAQDNTYHPDTLGAALFGVGMVLALGALTAASVVGGEDGCYECNLPRFGPD